VRGVELDPAYSSFSVTRKYITGLAYVTRRVVSSSCQFSAAPPIAVFPDIIYCHYVLV